MRPSDTSGYLDTTELEKHLGQYTLRGAAATLASQALTFIISLLGTALLARMLTPGDYGVAGMAATVVGLVGIIKNFGFDAAIIQQSEITQDQLSTLFWINAGLGLVLMLTAMCIAPAFAWFYGEPSLTWITAASATTLVLGGTIVQHEALLKRQMRFVQLSLIDIGSLLIGYVVAIFLAAWFHASYWALILSQVAIAITRTVAFWLSVGWRPSPAARLAPTHPLLVFGGNLTGFSLINYFARNVDNMLIGRYWGPHQLGLYSRAYQLLLLPLEQINTPVAAVAIPALSRLTDTPDRYRHAYLRLLEKIAIVTMPLMALLIMTSDWVVLLLLGPQWRAVTPIFTLLGIAGLVQPIGNTIGWLFVTQGRTEDLFRWGLIGGTLTIASIIVGLPWGATGVAASYSITYLFGVTPMLFWFVARRGPVRAGDFYRTIALPAAAGLTVLAALSPLRVSLRDYDAFLSLTAALGVTAGLTVLVSYAFPSGRAILNDVRHFLRILLPYSNERLS